MLVPLFLSFCLFFDFAAAQVTCTPLVLDQLTQLNLLAGTSVSDQFCVEKSDPSMNGKTLYVHTFPCYGEISMYFNFDADASASSNAQAHIWNPAIDQRFSLQPGIVAEYSQYVFSWSSASPAASIDGVDVTAKFTVLATLDLNFAANHFPMPPSQIAGVTVTTERAGQDTQLNLEFQKRTTVAGSTDTYSIYTLDRQITWSGGQYVSPCSLPIWFTVDEAATQSITDNTETGKAEASVAPAPLYTVVSVTRTYADTGRSYSSMYQMIAFGDAMLNPNVSGAVSQNITPINIIIMMLFTFFFVH